MFTISNGITKTPRDNQKPPTMCVFKAFIVRWMPFSFVGVVISEALCTQAFVFCRAVPWCRRLLWICGGSKPPPYDLTVKSAKPVPFYKGTFKNQIRGYPSRGGCLLFFVVVTVPCPFTFWRLCDIIKANDKCGICEVNYDRLRS